MCFALMRCLKGEAKEQKENVMGKYDGMTREELQNEMDPYNPDPELIEHLQENDSCTNEELGLDENGEPD